MHPTPARFRTIEQLRQDLTAGSASVVALCQFYADRISAATADGAGLNAVLSLNPELRSQAAAIEDSASASGLPLAGVPLLVKDNILTDGTIPTTCGSLALQHWVPGVAAPVVQGLRQAGALMLGKTNLSEWANFRSTYSSSGWSSVGGPFRARLRGRPFGRSPAPMCGCRARGPWSQWRRDFFHLNGLVLTRPN